ncbi:MAG: SGNH/GDSL hydrolase family protein [Ruminococcaceae bacterium]|nr:SGNH/GDSL hydrolase family protein [Oscillospiraceae bacterium]
MKKFSKRFLSMLVLVAVLCTSFPMAIATTAATDIALVSGSDLYLDSTNGYISGFSPATEVSDALAEFESSSEIKFVDDEGTALSGTDVIGTGSKVQKVQSGSVVDEYTVVVKGDTDGDGYVTIADVQASYKHLRGSAKLASAYANAAYTYAERVANKSIDVKNVEKTSVNDGVADSLTYIDSLGFMQLGYSAYFSVGELDLSKYSECRITYGAPAAFDVDAGGMPCIIGLKSTNSAYGWHDQTPYNLNGNLGYAAMEEASTDWAKRVATIDLRDVTYSGEVFVTSYVSNATVQAVYAVEFIGNNGSVVSTNRSLSILDVMGAINLILYPDLLDEECSAYSLEKYTKPYWSSNIIYNEAVMPLENKDGSISSIQLLYDIKDIVEVRSSDLTVKYTEGVDYTVEDGKFKIIPTGSINTIDYSFMYPSTASNNTQPDSTHGYMYFAEGGTFHSMQLAITYTPNSAWGGAKPTRKANLLPKTMAKLEAGEDLNVVLLGDSISVGANATGYVGVAPYSKNWYEMALDTLTNKYGSQMTFTNLSVGGMDSAWGVTQAATAAAKSPDLVILGFGMNDGSAAVATTTYKNNMKSIMDTIKASNPNVEFVLISTMLSNPDWAAAHNQILYLPVLNSFETTGCAVADITTIHQYMLTRKRFVDMTGNHVNHPNDFVVRLYAQVVNEVFKY